MDSDDVQCGIMCFFTMIGVFCWIYFGLHLFANIEGYSWITRSYSLDSYTLLGFIVWVIVNCTLITLAVLASLIQYEDDEEGETKE